MSAYPPAVEQWRGLVSKYFPSQLVDKALWVIQHESGGRPKAFGGGATGLFQIQALPGRPDPKTFEDPETNIRYAAQSLGAAHGHWSDWGEGTAGRAPYDAETNPTGRFGALGDHPYPGDAGTTAAGGTQMPPTSTGTNTTPDPATLSRLRQAAETLWKGVADGSVDPKDWLAAVKALDAYQKHGSFDATEDTRAQQAFDNAIKLGDYQGSQAAAAFGRWKDKRDAAAAATDKQLGEANDKNALNLKLSQPHNRAGEGVADDRTYFAPSYDDAFAKWKDKFGVGAEPSSNPADYPGPSQPTFGGDQGASAVAGVAAGDIPPLDPATQAQSDGFGSPMSTPKVPGDEHSTVFGLPDAHINAGLFDVYPFRWDPRHFTNGEQYPFQNVLHDAGKGIKKFGHLIGLKGGGRNVAEGAYQLGEQGLEHVVTPDGQVTPVGAQGPEVAMLPQGADVLPANVSPQQALMYAKLRQLMAQDQAQGPGRQMVQQQQRAQDPQLQQVVMAALRAAMANQNAVNPPPTPVLTGAGWQGRPDPWASWRPLTGVPPTGMAPAAPAKGGK